jgi:hypothetical protein
LTLRYLACLAAVAVSAARCAITIVSARRYSIAEEVASAHYALHRSPQREWPQRGCRSQVHYPPRPAPDDGYPEGDRVRVTNSEPRPQRRAQNLQPSVPNIQPRPRCLITDRSIRSRVWATFMPNMMFQSVRRMPYGVLVTISASQSPTNWPYNLSASACSGAGSSHAASGSGRKMSSSTFVPPQGHSRTPRTRSKPRSGHRTSGPALAHPQNGNIRKKQTPAICRMGKIAVPISDNRPAARPGATSFGTHADSSRSHFQF